MSFSAEDILGEFASAALMGHWLGSANGYDRNGGGLTVHSVGHKLLRDHKSEYDTRKRAGKTVSAEYYRAYYKRTNRVEYFRKRRDDHKRDLMQKQAAKEAA
jgi:hypothetical protein